MTAATPGQAAYEAHAGKMGGRRDAWGELPATYRDAWEAAAQAAIDAFLAGDSVSAESIREALAAHEQPAPGLAMLRADLADAEAQLAKWPRCPEGCGCRLATEDPFGRECGCDGPCGMECRENGYPDAPSYRDIPREDAQSAPELATGPCPSDGHDGEHLRLNTHGHWLCAITLTDMLVAADVITDLHPGQAACDLARARQGLRDLADVHDALLEEILRNAGEDMDLTGTPEDRAARYVRSLEAGRTQERPAPGAVPDLLPGRMDKLDRIAGMCRRPAEVAGRSSGSGIVSGTNLAAAILHVIEEES